MKKIFVSHAAGEKNGHLYIANEDGAMEEHAEVPGSIASLAAAAIDLAIYADATEIYFHAEPPFVEELRRQVAEREHRLYSTNNLTVTGV